MRVIYLVLLRFPDKVVAKYPVSSTILYLCRPDGIHPSTEANLIRVVLWRKAVKWCSVRLFLFYVDWPTFMGAISIFHVYPILIERRLSGESR